MKKYFIIIALLLSTQAKAGAIETLRKLNNDYPTLPQKTKLYLAKDKNLMQFNGRFRATIKAENAPDFLTTKGVIDAIKTTPEFIERLKGSLRELHKEMQHGQLVPGVAESLAYQNRQNDPASIFFAKIELAEALKDTVDSENFRSPQGLENILKNPLDIYKELDRFVTDLTIKQNTSLDLNRLAPYDTIDSFIDPNYTEDSPQNSNDSGAFKSLLILTEARALDEGQRLVYVKRLYPFVKLIDAFFPAEAKFFEELKARIIECERIYSTFQTTVSSLQEIYDVFNDLETDETCGVTAEVAQNFTAFFNEKTLARQQQVAEIQQLINQEYADVDRQVSDFLTRFIPEKKTEEPKAASTKKTPKSSIPEAIRLEQQLRAKAEQAALAQKQQSEDVPRRHVMHAQQFASNEAAYNHWYWASQDHNRIKRGPRHETTTKDELKAQAKAMKSHVATNDTATSSTSSTSSTSADVKTEAKKEAPALSSHHYRLYQSLFETTTKDTKLSIEEVGHMLHGLGGYIDPKRTGSRQALAIRDLNNGNLNLRVLHYHAKNGRKYLRPEQIVDIRDMLIEAGYAVDSVTQRNNSNDDDGDA